MTARDTSEFDRAYMEERLIVEATEGLWAALSHRGIKKSELAAKLKVQRSHVTQTMDGQRNLTLKTLAAFAWALGAEVTIDIRPAEFNERYVETHSVFETSARDLPSVNAESPITAGTNSYALAA